MNLNELSLIACFSNKSDMSVKTGINDLLFCTVEVKITYTYSSNMAFDHQWKNV